MAASAALAGRDGFRPRPTVEVGGWSLLWHIMRIYAHYGYDEYWQCMDTPRDLQHLTETWQPPVPPWKMWADE